MKQRSIISLGIFMVGAVLGIYLGLQLLQLASSTAIPTAQENPTGEAAYLEGRLTEVNYPLPATWTLDEELYPPQVWRLEVLSATEIITNGLEPVEGTWARVDAVTTEDSLQATRITLSPYPRPVTIEGQLTLVSSSIPGRWVLEHYPFEVNEETLIITNDLVAEPGTYARAELLKLPDGRLARSVELLIPAGQPGPAIELADWLVEMNDSTGNWQVGSRTVLVDASTVVEGSVEVGSLLRVRGSLFEGDLLAQLIQVLPADDGVVFQGIINAASDTVWMVDDITVLIEEDTVQSGLPARPGMWVQVQGQQIDTYTVRATYVWVNEAGPRQLVAWLQARYDDEEPELWQIGLIDGPETRSVFLEVGADIEIKPPDASLEYGMWIETTASPVSETYFRAHEAIIVQSHAPKMVVVGIVNFLPENPPADESQWMVGDYRVLVGPGTTISGAPQVGDLVMVTGAPDYTAALHAGFVERMQPE